MIDGLAVIDKPAGMTSHDVVSRCRRLFGQKKVGHAGTLDPDATGVLLVGLGRATRLLHFMSGLDKSYEADVVLGVATSTLDASGEVTGRWDQSNVTLDQARIAAAALVGPSMQIPPMVSAVKVGGRRLHELARAGIEVERDARRIMVTRFDVEPADPGAQLGWEGEGPVFGVKIDCSSGTYIRVLGSDLGRALGGDAYVRNLRRTAVGPWNLSDHSVPLEDLRPDLVVAPAASLPWLSLITASEDVVEAVNHGKVLDRPYLGVEGPGPWLVVDQDGQLRAIYQDHGEGRVKPAFVMPPE